MDIEELRHLELTGREDLLCHRLEVTEIGIINTEIDDLRGVILPHLITDLLLTTIEILLLLTIVPPLAASLPIVAPGHLHPKHLLLERDPATG